MVLRRSLPVLIALVSTLPLYAAETPIPESPTRWVTDTANFLPLRRAPLDADVHARRGRPSPSRRRPPSGSRTMQTSCRRKRCNTWTDAWTATSRTQATN